MMKKLKKKSGDTIFKKEDRVERERTNKSFMVAIRYNHERVLHVYQTMTALTCSQRDTRGMA